MGTLAELAHLSAFTALVLSGLLLLLALAILLSDFRRARQAKKSHITGIQRNRDEDQLAIAAALRHVERREHRKRSNT
jgi:hypothetical protein